MNAEQYQKLLAKLGACGEARHEADGKSLEEVWATCQRGDWMLWLAQHVRVNIKLLMLAKCDCAEQAIQYTTSAQPAVTIAVARRWAVGEATDAEMFAAARSAACAADAASWAAAWAARAADAAWAESLAESARRVRKRIAYDVILTATEAAGGKT